MPAVVAVDLPSLSQIQSWDTSHLTSAAVHWRANATSWEDAATEIYQQMANPGGRVWQGRTAEAAQQRAHDDRMKILGVADDLHAVSDLADAGANELAVAKRRVISVVAEAQASGFTVNEDLSVEYFDDGSATAAAKRAKALAFATELHNGAIQLAAVDQRVAADLTAVTSRVTALDFPEKPPKAPSPKDPNVTGLSVHDAEDVHKIVDPRHLQLAIRVIRAFSKTAPGSATDLIVNPAERRSTSSIPTSQRPRFTSRNCPSQHHLPCRSLRLPLPPSWCQRRNRHQTSARQSNCPALPSAHPRWRQKTSGSWARSAG